MITLKGPVHSIDLRVDNQSSSSASRRAIRWRRNSPRHSRSRSSPRSKRFVFPTLWRQGSRWPNRGWSPKRLGAFVESCLHARSPGAGPGAHLGGGLAFIHRFGSTFQPASPLPLSTRTRAPCARSAGLLFLLRPAGPSMDSACRASRRIIRNPMRVGPASKQDAEHFSRRRAELAQSRTLSVAGGVTTDLSAATQYASRFDNGEDNP